MTAINMPKILAHTLITAIETHIGMWLKPLTELVDANPDALDDAHRAVLADLNRWGGKNEMFVCPLVEGAGHLRFVDDEDQEHRVGHGEITTAVQLMHDRYPRHYGDLIAEQGDAWTADLLLQLACYGEERYA